MVKAVPVPRATSGGYDKRPVAAGHVLEHESVLDESPRQGDVEIHDEFVVSAAVAEQWGLSGLWAAVAHDVRGDEGRYAQDVSAMREYNIVWM